jgi:hypothetical protein
VLFRKKYKKVIPFTCQSAWLAYQKSRPPFTSKLVQKVQHIEQSRMDKAKVIFNMQAKWEYKYSHKISI